MLLGNGYSFDHSHLVCLIKMWQGFNNFLVYVRPELSKRLRRFLPDTAMSTDYFMPTNFVSSLFQCFGVSGSNGSGSSPQEAAIDRGKGAVVTTDTRHKIKRSINPSIEVAQEVDNDEEQANKDNVCSDCLPNTMIVSQTNDT